MKETKEEQEFNFRKRKWLFGTLSRNWLDRKRRKRVKNAIEITLIAGKQETFQAFAEAAAVDSYVLRTIRKSVNSRTAFVLLDEGENERYIKSTLRLTCQFKGITVKISVFRSQDYCDSIFYTKNGFYVRQKEGQNSRYAYEAIEKLRWEVERGNLSFGEDEFTADEMFTMNTIGSIPNSDAYCSELTLKKGSMNLFNIIVEKLTEEAKNSWKDRYNERSREAFFFATYDRAGDILRELETFTRKHRGLEIELTSYPSSKQFCDSGFGDCWDCEDDDDNKRFELYFEENTQRFRVSAGKVNTI